jgi:23S rRNA (pseudouridine1915-N3)-methyltransferase
MRATILAVGRMRGDPLAEAFAAYETRLARCFASFRVIEVEEPRKGSSAERKSREAALLQQAMPRGAVTIALDERGRALTSAELAAQLAKWRASGRDLAFIIGGADGLDESLRRDADHLLSLGALTWPHRMIRVMLAEQLFRADAILRGHPYHRA